MPSIDLLVSFAAAARHASFAGAARELGLSPSAVAKNVARLEGQLGLTLFQRTTRRMALTQDGDALHLRCQRILDELAELESAASGARTRPTGTLRVDVPITWGRRVLLPVLAALRRRHPELSLEIRFSDSYVDLVRDGLDAAVRIGALEDSRLVAQRIDTQTMWTCASPAYLRRHGTPGTPDELGKHTCLLFRIPSSGRDWPWRFRVRRREVTIHPHSLLRLGDGEALVGAAAAGLGIVHAPSYMADREVAAGRLVEILADYRPPGLPISIVHLAGRRQPLRLKILVDALLERHRAADATS